MARNNDTGGQNSFSLFRLLNTKNNTKKGKFRKDLATTKIRFLHAQLKTNANRDKTNFGARRCTMLIRLEEKSKPFAEIFLIFRKNTNIFRMSKNGGGGGGRGNILRFKFGSRLVSDNPMND